MASGLSNKLTGQIGEFLACAELGRRGFVATSFTGNVPEYDLLVCDDKLNTLPIQVKTSRSNTWPSKANQWLEIEIDEDSKRQINKGKKKIDNPDLIYISIVLGNDKKDDRFFISKKSDIQKVCILAYKEWMDPKDWIRPKNFRSLDNRYGVEHLAHFEDNWNLIQNQLDVIENNKPLRN